MHFAQSHPKLWHECAFTCKSGNQGHRNDNCAQYISTLKAAGTAVRETKIVVAHYCHVNLHLNKNQIKNPEFLVHDVSGPHVLFLAQFFREYGVNYAKKTLFVTVTATVTFLKRVLKLGWLPIVFSVERYLYFSCPRGISLSRSMIFKRLYRLNGFRLLC